MCSNAQSALSVIQSAFSSVPPHVPAHLGTKSQYTRFLLAYTVFAEFCLDIFKGLLIQSYIGDHYRHCIKFFEISKGELYLKASFRKNVKI